MRLTRKIVVFSSLCTTSFLHFSVRPNNSCLFVSIGGYQQSVGYLVFGVFGNEGTDSSSLTHGNLSSSQMAFCGANGAGSSSDAIVTSIVSESLASSKNKCVPQHEAKQRIRFAYSILRCSPFVTDKSSRGTDPQVT